MILPWLRVGAVANLVVLAFTLLFLLYADHRPARALGLQFNPRDPLDLLIVGLQEDVLFHAHLTLNLLPLGPVVVLVVTTLVFGTPSLAFRPNRNRVLCCSQLAA